MKRWEPHIVGKLCFSWVCDYGIFGCEQCVFCKLPCHPIPVYACIYVLIVTTYLYHMNYALLYVCSVHVIDKCSTI